MVLQDEWKVEFKGWMKSWFYKMNELVVQQDEETVGIIGWTNSDHESTNELPSCIIRI